MTQAPTPGPLTKQARGQLCDGDWLREDWNHGQLIQYQRPYDIADYRLSHTIFIGRPDESGWMPWSGGENPVPGQRVDWVNARGDEGSHLSDEVCGLGEPLGGNSPVVKWRPSRLAPTAPVEASGSERDFSESIIDCEIAREAFDNRPQPSGFLATLSDEQRSEAMSHIGDDTHPQPSGETREAVARLAWTYACSSDELDPQYDNGWSRALDLYANEPRYTDSAKAFVDRTWAFADAILALLSARPLALAGQQGEFLGHLVAPKSGVGTVFVPKGEPVPLMAGRGSVTPVYSGPQNVTTPARAEARDEGAAGERERLAREIDPIAFLDVQARAPGRNGERNAHAARMKALKKADEIIAARAHPSPTPALDEGAAGEPVGLDVLKGWKDPRAPFDLKPAAWRWRNPGGVWNYQEDRQIIPNTVCEPLYAHPSPTPAADADRVRIAVEALEKIEAADPYHVSRSIAAEALAALKSEGK